jgi:hypothetical protein
MKTTYSFPVDSVQLLGEYIAGNGLFGKKPIALISAQSPQHTLPQ